ncbi:MAG: hypothetical protein KDK53_19480 [Maritimibacter sp.]|nr:hypothetical protein [Maritimibacter sp.]
MAFGKGDHLHLIDGSAFIFRAYHALPPLTRKSDGLPIGAVAGFCNMLLRYTEGKNGGTAATHVAVIFDHSSKTFRNALFPDYKANRPELPEDLRPQFPLTREATRAFNIACVETEGYEADDIIATLTRQAVEAGGDVTIISSDKDLMQLVGPNVVMWDAMKDRIIGPAEVVEKFGVGPERVVDVQALAGDSVDNIPGAPGIGVKTAALLINEYGDLDTLLARADEIKQPKRRETLVTMADQIRLSRQLVTLCPETPLESKLEDFGIRPPEPEVIMGFLTDMEFRTLTRRLAEKLGVEAPAAAAAPRDVAASLRQIWAEVLGLPPADITGNFFDLGGYSVLALRMLAKVGAQFDRRPSLYAFLADPTIEGLTGIVDPSAKLLEPQAPPPAVPAAAPPAAPVTTAPDPVAPPPAAPVAPPVPQGPIWELVELRKSSADAPVLITVNQPFMFQSLARNMVSDCAVANLSVPDNDALGTLEAVGLDQGVDDALGTVLARYAGRPMMFCGLCVDGRVGLRLAQRLQDKGQDTVLVAMIDSWAPGASKVFSRLALKYDRWRIRFRRLRYYLGLRRKGEIGWADVLRKNAFAARLIERLTARPARDETEVLVDDTVDVLVKQTRAYAFDRYDGEVALFVTLSQGLVPRDGVLGWSELLSADTAVYPVNGWHGDSLMRSGFERIIGVLDAKAQRLNRDQTPQD